MVHWDDKPIREELFGLERLEAHAVSLAAAQDTTATKGDSAALRIRLHDNMAALSACYSLLQDEVGAGASIPPAADWLLDNYYVLQQQLEQIEHDLPPRYYRQLPKLGGGPFRSLPRVFGIAWAYVAHTDSHFSPDTLESFLKAYQRVAPLTIGELWAVAITLRILLIENLRRLTDQIMHDRQLHRQADLLADQLIGNQGSQASQVPPVPEGELPDALLVRLVQRLRDHDPQELPAFRWVEERVHTRGLTLDELVQQYHLQQGAANVTVRNIILSLKLISEYTWPDLIEAVSKVDELLHLHPGFAQMDFSTRNAYRTAVEQIARGSRQSELDVTRLALAAAANAAPEAGPHAAEPGFWLIGEGRPQFNRRAGYRPPAGEFLVRLNTSAGLTGYLLSITLLTAALLALPLGILAAYGIPGWHVLLLALTGLLPASSAAVAITNRIMTVESQVRVLPGLELKGGVPREYRTLLVIPAILTDQATVTSLLEQLEIHHLSNPAEEIFLALLSDFTDATSESTSADAELLQAARSGIARLNERYPSTTARFLLLHRPREWVEADGVWRGWERKRGKLQELNRLLRGAEDTAFSRSGVPLEVPAGVKFVLTLDADSRLPPGAAQKLIGKLAHPLNRPVVNPDSGRVEYGHAVIQPRVSPAMPPATQDSPYHAITAGDGGLDPYASAVSDVYQDMFDEGSYAGKGIYDVDAFATALEDRVPDNTLLSHDLLEGIYARAALATDVEVVEAFPHLHLAARSRQHRWVRGDWQLLPWLLGRRNVPGKSAAWNRMPALGRWKISDNLRRSLVEPATFLALLVGWLLQPVTAALWTIALLLMLAVSPFLPILTSLLPQLPGVPLRVQLQKLGRNSRRALQQLFLVVTLLADQAAFLSDAISRALNRTFRTGRNMLEWVTAAQLERKRASWLQHYQAMAGGVLLSAFTFTLLLFLNPAGLPYALPLLLLWFFSPLIAWQVSRSRRPVRTSVSPRDAKQLERVAQHTWAFFIEFVTAESNHLPPDNFQETPEPVVAQRTSPTNLGLYLLSIVSAREFGWLNLDAALDRFELTLETMLQLPRFRGHFYNWYDTLTLAILQPAYVSTVDSGNLAAHLLTAAASLNRWAGTESDPALQERALTLAATCTELGGSMDFSFLYDSERRLLAIGMQVTEGKLDAGRYDLLASEANLASLIAIAQGDVPAEHWFRLGRNVAALNGSAVLLSWSGSMFEYLMPSLVLDLAPDSMLARTNELVVTAQQRYGQQRNVPWGVSESAFNARDIELTYQYSPFGIPELGLKRGLAQDTVISPHATGLAAMVDPHGAALNFARLEQLGAFTQHGFYEALDFTPARVPQGQDFAPVRAFMAHHQGMALCGLANTLLDGVLQRDFHSQPRVQAVELLLQERPPDEFIELRHPTDPEFNGATALRGPPPVRHLSGPAPEPDGPTTHLLSNGRYSVLVTAAGSGYSRWNGLDVTRWREDPVRDNHGSFIYLQDEHSGEIWSAGHEPLGRPAVDYQVDLSEDRVCITRHDPGMITALDVIVSPETDAEVRRVTLTNTGSEDRVIRVTSFLELALAAHSDDQAHPAFAKMFVETVFDGNQDVLYAWRRQRDLEAPEVQAAHFAVVTGDVLGRPEFETDRLQFLGRNRDASNPQALQLGRTLAGNQGTVLDPAFALRYRLRIPAGSHASIAFWTAASSTRAKLDKQVSRLRDADAYDRTATLAWTQAQVALRHLGVSPGEAHAFQRLAGFIIYASDVLRAPETIITRGAGPQSGLWSLGISGDLPLVLVTIENEDNLRLVRQLLRAHGYWREKRLAVDLVILNERSTSYAQELQQTLEALVRSSRSDPDEPGNIFVLRADQLTQGERLLLQSSARIVLQARRGSLTEQFAVLDSLPVPPHAPPAPAEVPESFRQQPAADSGGLDFFNGYGGFDPATGEYVIPVRRDRPTPAPWINVIANARFGFQVSASGSGYTWSGNSKENQLTPWSNDPVTDPPGEVFYLRDEETGRFWTPTPEPAGGDGTVRHGFGYSQFSSARHGLHTELRQFVPTSDPVKLSHLTLENTGTTERRISVTAYAEWVLGPARSRTAQFLSTEHNEESGALLASNAWSSSEAEPPVAFFDLAGPNREWTCDRREFLGRYGSSRRPAALFGTNPLAGRAGAGLDPCAAQRVTVTLAPGASVELTCLLGQAPDRAEALRLVRQYRSVDPGEVLREVTGEWQDTLQTVQVSTPDAALDVLLNGWLTYQTLTSRIYARSAFYQASGAYGFRDQLQDGMSLVLVRPDLVREHLLRAASRQFTQGDVQHWWLPGTGQGIRTRISDDRGWLAFSTAHYVRTSGDVRVLDEEVPFLSAPPLEPGETDRFDVPEVTTETASLYEHCALALDDSLRTGVHGLPLIGTGDWNDGMNRVGEQGRGESVWLGWFLHRALGDFIPLARKRGDTVRAGHWEAFRQEVSAAIEEHGWDGEWYRRAFFDDGTPLGSRQNLECQVDSIAQSWAVLSGAADSERARQGMEAVKRFLIRSERQLALLFTPPFSHTELDPGYIKAYPPGLRENGGQYTHAATWSVIALAQLGQGDEAGRLLQQLNPINHALDTAAVETYRVEPYVVPADIYSVAPNVGRGGWTWYTGSAAWLQRAALESVLGFVVEDDSLRLDPCIPSHWPEYAITYRHHDCVYSIVVRNPHGLNRGVSEVTLDGQVLADARTIPLQRSGQHELIVTLG